MRFFSGPGSFGARGTGRVLLSIGGLMSLVMIPASAVTNLSGEYTYTTNSDPLAIYAVNNNTASGASGVQANSSAAGGKGVFGYSNASGAPGFGVAGISQNGYGVYGSSYGVGITAIYGENLSGGGIGVQGASSGGTGIYGVGLQHGVEGQTNSTNGTYAGVLGIDNASGSGSAYGVEGMSKAAHTAIAGFNSGSGFGLYASSNTGTALEAYTVAASSGIGYLGLSTGEGGDFLGYSGTAAHPATISTAIVTGTDILGGYLPYNSSLASYPESFIVQGTTSNRSGVVRPASTGGASDVQISGDLYVYGRIYTDCNVFPANAGTSCAGGPLTATQTSSTGAKLRTYAPQQSMKTIEDFGEAQLVNGRGYVALESTFASSIARSSYLVFITPEGDSRGLYVTGKGPGGFTVRESTGGRSSLAFQYRIVAQPFGEAPVRMAAIGPKTMQAQAFVPGRHLDASALKGRGLRPTSLGDRVTRPPHLTVRNLHRL